MAYVPPLNGGRINASIAGNTTGNSSASAVSTGTVVFAGGNNVTLSQATGVNGATLSFNAASQSVQSLAFSAGGNTTLTSAGTFDARSMFLNGLGAATAGFSQSSIFVSAPALSSVSASGIINISTAGNIVSIGAPAFSAGMSTIGNTAGNTGTITNQIVFAGGNNITLSQSTGAGGNTLNVSGLSFANSNGMAFGINAGTLTASYSQSNPAFSAQGGSSTFQTLSFSNGNGISFTNNAGQVGASYTVPTVSNSSLTMQAGVSTLSSVSRIAFGDGNGISFGASTSNNGSITITGTVATNYAASTHTHGSPTLNLTNLSGTTASASNGLTLSLSAAAQTVEQQSIGIGGTAGGSSATVGSVSATGGQIRYNFYAGSNINLSQSANGASGSLTISAAAGGGAAISAAGASASNGTVVFANSNGMAFGMNGSTVTASYTVPTQSNQTLSVAATGNTTGNTSGMSYDARSMTLQGAGMVSVGFSTTTGGSSSLVISATQSIQTISFSAGSQSTLTGGGTFGANSMFINGVGAVKAGFSQSSIFVSVPNQTVETQSIGMLGGGAGSTAGTSGNATGGQLAYNFYAGTNITLSQSLNGASASLTIQGGAGGGGGGIAFSNSQTSYSNGTVQLLEAAGAAITIASTTGSKFNVSVPGTSSLMGTGAVTISTNGSTISIGAPATSSLALSGALTASTAGNTMTLGVQMLSAGVSNLSNDSGSTGMVSNQLVLAGGNNITLSQSTNATGATVSVIGGAGGGGGGGIALSGGGTSYSSGTINLSAVAGAALTISGSTNSVLSLSVPGVSNLTAAGPISLSSAGSTVTISALPYGTISNWEPTILQNASLTNTQIGNATVLFMKLMPEAYVSATQLLQLVNFSLSVAGSSHKGTVSLQAGIFTANGSTLNLITQSSGSTAYTWTNSSSNSLNSLSGLRGLSLPMTVNMAPGNYWLGLWSKTSMSTTQLFTVSNMMMAQFGAGTNSSYNGILGQATNATQGVQEAIGIFGTSASLPTSAAMSKITQNLTASVSVPYIAFKNVTF